jgi:HD-like signal output (HDOD) protein
MTTVGMATPEPVARGVGFLAELVDRALSLPMGDPAALGRVVQLCSVAASSQEVALEARRDEAFVALLLRTVNSAAFYTSERIADLPSAITRLGLRRVQALALAAPGLQMLKGPADDLKPARAQIHRHAIRTGLAARALAPPGTDGDRALAAGLLHNLGLMVISAHAPDVLRHLLDATAREEQFAQAEEWILGFSHAELGSILAEHWSYPLDLVVAIRDHDSPAPETPLAALVQIADQFVRRLGVGIEPPGPLFDNPLLPQLNEEAAMARVEELVRAQDRFDETL